MWMCGKVVHELLCLCFSSFRCFYLISSDRAEGSETSVVYRTGIVEDASNYALDFFDPWFVQLVCVVLWQRILYCSSISLWWSFLWDMLWPLRWFVFETLKKFRDVFGHGDVEILFLVVLI